MKSKGFTLIELLAVVLIIGILTAIAVPQYRKSLERSRVAEAYSMMPAIRESLLRWAKENNKNWREWESNNGQISLNIPLPAWNDEVSFNVLDISMKGKQTAPHTWETKNFTYQIFIDEIGSFREWWPVNASSVKATFKRGRYAGSSIYLVGGTTFLCGRMNNNNADDDTPAEICDVLGLTVRVPPASTAYLTQEAIEIAG